MMLLQQHEQTALIWRDQHVSYLALLEQVDGYARLLPRDGVGKAAIFSENRLEWVYAYYAGLKRGCTLVPIDFMSAAEDVAYILDDCLPELVFCSSDTRAVMDQAIARSKCRPRVLLLDEMAAEVAVGKPDPLPSPSPDKTLLLIYTSGTSGTTGSPKGVMLSWDNLLANIESVSGGAHPLSGQWGFQA